MAIFVLTVSVLVPVMVALPSGNDSNDVTLTECGVFINYRDIDEPIIIESNDDIAQYATSGGPGSWVIAGKIILTDASFDVTYDTFVLGRVRENRINPGISIRGTTDTIVLQGCIVANELGSSGIPLFLENNENVIVDGCTFDGDSKFLALLRGNYADPQYPTETGTYRLHSCSFSGVALNAQGEIVTTDHAGKVVMDGCSIVNEREGLGYCIGLNVISTNNLELTGTSFEDCGFKTDGNLPYILDYTVSGNLVNGNQLRYITSQSGFVLDGDVDGTLGQLYIIGCHDFEVRDHAISGGSFPLQLAYCHEAIVDNVVITNSTFDGLFLNYCHSMTIQDSLFEYNLRGGVLFGFTSSEVPSDKNVIKNNIARNNGRNIRLLMTSNTEVTGNTVYFTSEIIDLALSIPGDDLLYGFEAQSPFNCSWKDNIVFNCTTAIGIGEFYNLRDTDNITISGNKFTGFGEHVDGLETLYGIRIDQGAFNVIIEDNSITGHETGISTTANDGIIRRNDIANNVGYGIYMLGSGNQVYRNNFIDNNAGGDAQARESTGRTNDWHDPSAMLGNYWSDYEDRYPSATNDGTTWNVPYDIPYDASDPYPLVNPHVADPIGRQLDAIGELMDELETLIGDNLEKGRERACSVQLENARERLESLVVLHENSDPLDMNAIRYIESRMHAISMVSKDDEITATCDEIVKAISTLRSLLQ